MQLHSLHELQAVLETSEDICYLKETQIANALLSHHCSREGNDHRQSRHNVHVPHYVGG